MATTFTGDIASGYSSWLGVSNKSGRTERYGGKTTYAESVLAELDDVHKAIAHESDKTPTDGSGYFRRMPEVTAFWVGIEDTYGNATGTFPEDEIAFGLRQRGISPVIFLSIDQGKRMDANGAYKGAPVDTTGGLNKALPSRLSTDFGSGYLANWDSAHADRNWAQLIIDGDLDDWLDDFAQDIFDFASLNSYAGDDISSWREAEQSGWTGGATKNAKGEDISSFGHNCNKVVIRFASEPNGLQGNRMPNNIPYGDTAAEKAANRTEWERGRDEVVAAFAYVSDRIRNNGTVNSGNGVDNAYFMWCLSSQAASTATAPHTTVSYPRFCFDTTLRTGNYVHFLAQDIYNSNGKGIEASGQNKSMLGHNGGAYDQFEKVFGSSDWGGGVTPMIIAEWGMNLSSENNADGTIPGTKSLKWDCTSQAANGSWNEACRGRWIRDTGGEITRYRDNTHTDHQKYKAIKGMMYFSMDLPSSDIWSLWRESNGFIAGGSSNVAPGWDQDSKEPRPTQAEAAADQWKNDNDSGTEPIGTTASDSWFAFRRWAQLWDADASGKASNGSTYTYGSTFRGYGGALFDENPAESGSSDL